MSRQDGGIMRLAEVLTSGSSHAAAARAMLHTASAASFICGAAWLEELDGGWVRPHRFGPAQERALESCLAWHPGLYRQMARTTTGVCLRFLTDAREIALALRMDMEPRGTASILSKLDTGRRRAHDGVSILVDGTARGCYMPQPLARSLPWVEDSDGMTICTFSLQDDDEGSGTMAIPGLGAKHEVCIWLPSLRGCVVRELWVDGTFVEPLASRMRMVVFGDDAGQGFCADDPLLAWPALIAEGLSLELVNQSVCGQVFQASALMGEPLNDVSLVIVQLGACYRHEPCPPSQIKRDVRAFFREVARKYEQARIVAVTPMGYDVRECDLHPRSSAREVPAILRASAREQGFGVVNGKHLMDQNDSALVDAEHPHAVGHVQIASRLATVLRERHIG